MAQREPVVAPTDEVAKSARRKRAELRRFLSQLENRSQPATLLERERLLRLAQDAFADVPTSSYEFIRRKHRELDEEEAQLRGEPNPS
jgi:hypothetical protein